MLDVRLDNIQDDLLSMARLHTDNDREAARLAECVFQRVCAEPELLADASALPLIVTKAAGELWTRPAD